MDTMFDQMKGELLMELDNDMGGQDVNELMDDLSLDKKDQKTDEDFLKDMKVKKL